MAVCNVAMPSMCSSCRKHATCSWVAQVLAVHVSVLDEAVGSVVSFPSFASLHFYRSSPSFPHLWVELALLATDEVDEEPSPSGLGSRLS